MSSSSSYYYNEDCFRAPYHQEIYQKYIHKKVVTPEKAFDLQEGQYPEIGEQISLRGWRRLSKPRTKISNDLVQGFYSNANLQLCLRTSKTSSLVWLVHPSLNMSSSSSYYYNEDYFRAPYHQEIYQKYIHKKVVTPEKAFDLQEGQYPEIGEQISLRGWRRLSKPRTKISKDLVQGFYSNAVRTEEEL
ncbi:hypothetical protein PIB30_102182 [Stylosanthes scabra]|uniref:Uncharacterized protein n=1 Tax=Stylosanthes scabra TaxID=79078 RepID=A0ABU6Y020_9FABA|nr:hypothetical protein [Stylosanthes scabra]